MYEELDKLLSQTTTDDAWYDDGFLLAQDILKGFVDEDWEQLNKEILSKDRTWQKKLAYCIDNQLIEQELVVIRKLLQVQDDELTEMCIDSLRSFDNEIGYSFIKNMDFLKYFFEMVFMDHDSEGTIYIDKLKYLAKYNGVGVEGAGGHYDPNEEDYKEGYFTLDFYSPSPFEKVTYVENNVFYKELADLCAEHMKIRPEDKECVEKYLRVIKQNLKLCF